MMLEENFTVEEAQATQQAFNHKCFKCGKKENLTLDHYYPLNKGFVLTLNNAMILCRSCNSSKSDLYPEEFFSTEDITLIEEIMKKAIEIYYSIIGKQLLLPFNLSSFPAI
jgi:hypothetical protein